MSSTIRWIRRPTSDGTSFSRSATRGASAGTLTSTTTATRLLRSSGIPLNPQVNSVNYFGNGGHGSYNAMLAGLKHQFAHQFMLDARTHLGEEHGHKFCSVRASSSTPTIRSLSYWGGRTTTSRSQEKILRPVAADVSSAASITGREDRGRLVVQWDSQPAYGISLESDLHQHCREPVLLDMQRLHESVARGLSWGRGTRNEQRRLQIGTRRGQWREQELPQRRTGVLHSARSDGRSHISSHRRPTSAVSRHQRGIR